MCLVAFVNIAFFSVGCATTPPMAEHSLVDGEGGATIVFQINAGSGIDNKAIELLEKTSSGTENITLVRFEDQVVSQNENWNPIIVPSGKMSRISIRVINKPKGKLNFANPLALYKFMHAGATNFDLLVHLTCPPLEDGAKYRLSFVSGGSFNMTYRYGLVLTNTATRAVIYNWSFECTPGTKEVRASLDEEYLATINQYNMDRLIALIIDPLVSALPSEPQVVLINHSQYHETETAELAANTLMKSLVAKNIKADLRSDFPSYFHSTLRQRVFSEEIAKFARETGANVFITVAVEDSSDRSRKLSVVVYSVERRRIIYESPWSEMTVPRSRL